MLRPKALSDALRQSLSPNIHAIIVLILPDGAPLATAISPAMDSSLQVDTLAAIMADTWSMYTQRPISNSHPSSVDQKSSTLGASRDRQGQGSSGSIPLDSLQSQGKSTRAMEETPQEPTRIMIQCEFGHVLLQNMGGSKLLLGMLSHMDKTRKEQSEQVMGEMRLRARILQRDLGPSLSKVQL